MAVITISRQYGSGGNIVAIRLAEMLGYRIFDKKLMANVAHEAGLSESEIIDYSESDYKSQGFLERFTDLFGELRGEKRTVKEISHWIRQPSGERTRIIQALDAGQAVDIVRSTVRAAYKHGNLIIVGRGGQMILADEPDVLHVRVVAPLEKRIKTIQAVQSLGYIEAENLVRERDRAMATYVKRFYDLDVPDATPYHMVLNTGKWNVDTIARVIINAVSQMPSATA